MARLKEEEQALTFPLDLGIDNTALPQSVQPPFLVESVNTRLSKTRGVPVKAPDVEELADVTGDCMGIVPCGRVDSTIAFFPGGHKRVVGSEVTDYLDSGTQSAETLNLALPVEVTSAGVLPCGENYSRPSMAYDTVNECIWSTAIRADDTGNDAILYVSAMGTDGRILVQPTEVVRAGSVTPTAGFPFVEITPCAGNAGVLIWYVTAGSTSVFVRRVALSDLDVAIGAVVTLYTPVESHMAVADGEDGFAYLATFDSATNTTIVVHRIDTSDLTVDSSTSKTSYIATGGMIDIAYYSGYLLIGTVYSAGTVNALCLTAATLAELWSTTGITGSSLTADRVRVGWMVHDGTRYAFSVTTDLSATLSSGSRSGSHVRTMDANTGSTYASYALAWMYPLTRPIVSPVGALLQVHRSYNAAAAVTDFEFITDPSVEVLRMGPLGASVIARLGVDLAYTERDISGSGMLVSDIGMAAYDASVVVTYRVGEGGSYADGMVVRYATLNFGPWQPPYALTDDGAAIIAGALPLQWDGATLTEVAPLHRPAIAVTTTGGTGPSFAAGDYRTAAVVVWRDACGVLHRSMPSQVVTTSHGGTDEPIYNLATPLTSKDGKQNERYRVEWYSSLANGTVLYSTPASGLTRGSFYDTWSNNPLPVAGAFYPPIYSDGDPSQALMAQCPPAASDVVLVGSRAWLIDAERPNVLWPSKLREPGIAYEWNSDLRLYLNSSCGKAVALAETQGQLVVLTDTGAFVVNGQGPDNLGRGVWAEPQKLLDLPCTSRASVVSTPAGVIYQSNERFVILGKGEVPNVDATAMGTCVAAILAKKDQEAIFVGTALTYVYNYSLDRWTTWEHLPAPTAAAITNAGRSGLSSPTGLVIHDGSTLYLADLDSTSQTAQMSWTTGDITFGGPQDDCIVSDVLIHGRWMGSHGMTVTLTPDYGQSTAVTKTFSAADVLAATSNGQYTLSCHLGTHSMRALKVAIQETGAAGQGAQPTAVSILVSKNPGTKRDAVKPAGRK